MSNVSQARFPHQGSHGGAPVSCEGRYIKLIVCYQGSKDSLGCEWLHIGRTSCNLDKYNINDKNCKFIKKVLPDV